MLAVRHNGEKGTEDIAMSAGDDRERGFKWWLRYVIVPLIGGGGIVAIVVTTISSPTIKPHLSISVVPSPSTNANPEELISIVQEQQRKNVKESWGELAHQCFTDNDLARFVRNKTTERITDSLLGAPEFLDVVLAIRKMELSKHKKLLISVDKPLRPTWAEFGRISREGQTEAGQDAERMIATAIVSLVKELVGMPEAEFLSLYND
jgi:hypothetical protein